MICQFHCWEGVLNAKKEPNSSAQTMCNIAIEALTTFLSLLTFVSAFLKLLAFVDFSPILLDIRLHYERLAHSLNWPALNSSRIHIISIVLQLLGSIVLFYRLDRFDPSVYIPITQRRQWRWLASKALYQHPIIALATLYLPCTFHLCVHLSVHGLQHVQSKHNAMIWWLMVGRYLYLRLNSDTNLANLSADFPSPTSVYNRSLAIHSPFRSTPASPPSSPSSASPGVRKKTGKAENLQNRFQKCAAPKRNLKDFEWIRSKEQTAAKWNIKLMLYIKSWRWSIFQIDQSKGTQFKV